MKEKMLRAIEECGYLGRVVSIEHLHELKEAIETNYRRGLFDEAFYQEYLTDLVFHPPEDFPEVKSLVVVAVRRPQIRFIFNWQGNRMPVNVPPTCLHWQETDSQVEKMLTDILKAEGYRVAPAILPKKLLAVRSGLAEYGKNNISYVKGMGSFHRLVVFYFDLPCEKDDCQEPKLMNRCKSCQACVHNCPSGAITTERFLLRAERCIVFHNPTSPS